MTPTPVFNPLGLRGIAFVEFTAPDPGSLDPTFRAFGFSRLDRHVDQRIVRYQQGDIHLLLNRVDTGFAADFASSHGPGICGMGWLVDDPQRALTEAVARGAESVLPDNPYGYPAIRGVGDLVLYLVDARWQRRFVALDEQVIEPDKGFLVIDHLTNNVAQGTMEGVAAFYKQVFGFTEVRTFDIRGEKTGLTSYALRSPDGSFCIPINEATEDKSQIQEYLDEYNGAGVQHLAFLSRDLLGSLDALEGCGIDTLDIDDEYYETVFDRVPGVREDHARIQRHEVLVDGDDEGYLLQIFTKNLFGPIFIELIQRENHRSFGEGNFGALFRSIERDQERRGVL